MKSCALLKPAVSDIPEEIDAPARVSFIEQPFLFSARIRDCVDVVQKHPQVLNHEAV
jgi:hypothetical protein